MTACNRCGGQILRNYDEETCLQCGHENGVNPTVEKKGSRPREYPRNTERRLSDSAAQIRRRRRRLALRGYSVSEIEKIIREQVGD